MSDLSKLLVSPGPGAWRVFLPIWHGEPERDPRSRPARGPEPLRRFWSEVGAWPQAIVQNKLRSPDEATVEDGRLIFYVENQHVASWSTLLEGDDPPVWYRYEDDESDWQEEGARLDRFLLQLLVFEATIGSSHTLSAVDRTGSQVEAITGEFRELPLTPWLFPTGQTRFFVSDQALAFVEPAGPGVVDSFEMFIAGRNADDLDFLRGYVDPAWIVSDGLIADGW